MTDTTQTAQDVQTKVQRSLTGVQRLEIAFEMSVAARELSMARLRMEHPNWTDTDLRKELLRYAFLPDPLPEALR